MENPEIMEATEVVDPMQSDPAQEAHATPTPAPAAPAPAAVLVQPAPADAQLPASSPTVPVVVEQPQPEPPAPKKVYGDIFGSASQAYGEARSEKAAAKQDMADAETSRSDYQQMLSQAEARVVTKSAAFDRAEVQEREAAKALATLLVEHYGLTFSG